MGRVSPDHNAGNAADSDPRRLLGAALCEWASSGGTVGVVRVLDRHGLGTTEAGQLLAAGPDGTVAGVLLRGAMDDAARPLAAAATSEAGTVDAHIDEDPAVAAGLACAGGARLLGHPVPAALAEALGAALSGGQPAALVATADGASCLALTGPELETVHGTLGAAAVDEAAAERTRRALRRGTTVTERVELAGLDALVDLWLPVPTVLVVGTGAIGEAVAAQAAVLGWSARTVTGLDEARAAVAELTDADVLVLLDHDAAFDALLIDAVRGRGFVGALGSRHTQAARRERLRAAGLTEAELARVHGPVGLDLGARSPAETAVSIVAEVIAERSGRAPTALAVAEGRIGG